MSRTAAAEQILKEQPLNVSPNAPIYEWLDAYRLDKGKCERYSLHDFVLAELFATVEHILSVARTGVKTAGLLNACLHQQRLMMAYADLCGKTRPRHRHRKRGILRHTGPALVWSRS